MGQGIASCCVVAVTKWRVDLDLRMILAAAPVVVAESQVSVFDETRVRIYASTLVLSAIAGIAYQLRVKPLTLVACAAAMLNCGLLGLSVTLFGMSTWAASYPEALIGSSIFLGLGGMRTLEAVEKSGPDIILSLPKAIAQWVLGRDKKEGDQ